MTFAVIAIFAVVVLEIVSDTQSDYSNTSDEYYALGNITEGISNITERMGLLGTIIVLAVIIAVVVGALGFAMR
ncbi:MAG: hypothetical protein R6U11_08140 [Bacteroidales bacterium]